MSLFVFSVLAGLLFHQLISIIQPEPKLPSTPGKRRHRRVLFGRRVILMLPERVYLAWKARAIAAAIVLFVLLVVIVAVQDIHPPEGYAFRFVEALTSPRIASAFFGGLLGLLLGNLLNRVLAGSRNYELTSRDRLEILLILLLLVLGVGGEEIIRSYATRIQRISIGATNEISFAEAPARTSGKAIEQTRNAYRSSGGSAVESARPSGSSGLIRVSQLSGTIKRDGTYLKLFDTYDGPRRAPGDADLSVRALETFTATTVGPIASCLSGVYARSANATFLNERLAILTHLFHRLTSDSAEKADIREQVRAVFAEQALHVGKRAYDIGVKVLLERSTLTSDEGEFLAACRPLVNQLCPTKDQTATSQGAMDDMKSARDCLSERFDGRNSDPVGMPMNEIAKKYVERDKRWVSLPPEVNLNDESRARPYLAIAYAGLLAQLGYFDAAALALDNWINAAAKDAALPSAWYVLRARFALAGYLEEWIRSKSDNIELSLRQYHIDNFEMIIAGMRNLRTLAEAQRLSGEATLTVGVLVASLSGDDGICAAKNDDEQRLLGKLYESYISALTGFVDHSLKHAKGSRRSASRISTYVRELSRISLKCVDADVKRELRAEMLQLYARNQLNLVESTASLKDNDTLRQQLSDAQRVLRLAAELIERQQAADRARATEMNFLSRVASTAMIERYDSILSTQRDIREAERTLSQ